QDARRRLFSRQLFKKAQSPLTPALWRDVLAYTVSSWSDVASLFSEWWKGFVDPQIFALIAVAALLLWAVLFSLARRLLLRVRTYEGPMPAPFLRRAASAGGATLTRSLPVIISTAVFGFGLWYFDMLSGRIEPLMVTALYAICAVTIIWAMIRSVLAPNRPEWRVLNISDRGARRLCWLATGVAVIHAGDAILSKLNFILESPLPLTVAQHFVTSVAVALLLIIMLRMPLSEGSASAQEAPGQRRLTRALLRAILWACVLVMLASAFLGYVAFARFLMNQVVLTASLIILFYLLHIGIEDFANSLTDPERPAGRWLKDNLDLEPQRHAHLGLLASLFLHILLLCLFIPILLLQWGFDWEDIRL
ncbi:MAG: DUF3772 domain-containing protein, partial [Alphaproteobacteria bacterium]